jgi:hypothetical protein
MKLAIRTAMAGPVFAAGVLALTLNAPPVLTAEQPVAARANAACVFASGLDNFQVLDNERLILWAPGRKQPYLITLAIPSPDMRWGESLGFYDRDNDGMICGYGPDAVVVPRGSPQRIAIRSMEKITPEQAQELTVSVRKGIGKEPSAASRK